MINICKLILHSQLYVFEFLDAIASLHLKYVGQGHYTQMKVKNFVSILRSKNILKLITFHYSILEKQIFYRIKTVSVIFRKAVTARELRR